MKGKGDSDKVVTTILEALRKQGVDLDDLCCSPGDEAPRLKVVCLPQSMRDIVSELSQTPRDQVVMVRVDAETCRKLDAWVETGAVKSRSEAAALFIREGLNARKTELDKLEKAINEVEKAKAQLRSKAQKIIGGSDEGHPSKSTGKG